jgi:hypothetical protein
MAITNFTIIPVDNVVVFDGIAVHEVPMDGMDPDIHAVQWYGKRKSGTVEYKTLEDGTLPEPLVFEDPAEFSPFLEVAQEVREIHLNPTVFYAIQDDVVYKNIHYRMGEAMFDTTYPRLKTPPAGFTDKPLPVTAEPSTEFRWQWDEAAQRWIYAAFDIKLGFNDAKAYLTSVVRSQGSRKVNNQCRDYSYYEIGRDSADNLVPADSWQNGYQTVKAYQEAIDALVNPKLETIAKAPDKESLYSFDPAIPEPEPVN